MRQSTRGNRRILVVDDDPSIHEAFEKVFKKLYASAWRRELHEKQNPPAISPEPEDFELSHAKNGTEALKLLIQQSSSRPFSVAFVDVRMEEEMDGLETTRCLWRWDPRLQVVLLTAFSDHTWKDLTRQFPGCANLLLVRKPVEPIEILQLAYSLSAKWSILDLCNEQLDNLVLASKVLFLERQSEVAAQALSTMRAEIEAMQSTLRALQTSQVKS